MFRHHRAFRLLGLRSIPAHYFKIDSSLVGAAPNDRVARAMISAIVRMQIDLGVQTVAESVESDLELQDVRSLGVDYAQGYLFEQWLASQSSPSTTSRSPRCSPPRLSSCPICRDTSSSPPDIAETVCRYHPSLQYFLPDQNGFPQRCSTTTRDHKVSQTVVACSWNPVPGAKSRLSPA